jgi:hypothetical protein
MPVALWKTKLYLDLPILNSGAVWYNMPRQEAEMTSFNRIVATLVLLVLIPVVTVGLIVPREAIELVRDGLNQLDDQLNPSVSVGWLVLRVALALVVDGLLIFLLYLQLRRPVERAVSVPKIKGGEAQIAIDSVVDRLRYHVDGLPGVLDVTPKILPHRRRVEVTLDIEMAADVNVPISIEEISAVARQVIEEEMGLKLKGKPRLHLRTVAFPERVAGAGIPSPSFSVTEAGDGEEDAADLKQQWQAPAAVDKEIESGEADEPGSADIAG